MLISLYNYVLPELSLKVEFKYVYGFNCSYGYFFFKITSFLISLIVILILLRESISMILYIPCHNGSNFPPFLPIFVLFFRKTVSPDLKKKLSI